MGTAGVNFFAMAVFVGTVLRALTWRELRPKAVYAVVLFTMLGTCMC